MPHHGLTVTAAALCLLLSDPLYSAQAWVYDMINVVPVWEQGILGTGVRVRINANRVDTTHDEFAGRYDNSASCTTPEPEENTNSHGTAVASILAAASNNDACSVGIAPSATLSSCNVFSEDSQNDLPGVLAGDKVSKYDISQNSFGFPACKPAKEIIIRRRLEEACPFETSSTPCEVCDFSDFLSAECQNAINSHCNLNYKEDQGACSDFVNVLVEGGACNYDSFPDAAAEALESGIVNGRGGKGIIYVVESGDDYALGGDVNMNGFTNSRYTISVGAVNIDGFHASYSTPGAALFVSAPGGDVGSPSGHITANANGGCQNAGYGTSFASPVVSGVVALMLETNPDLSWIDVQWILKSTSQPVNDAKDDTAATNGASSWHSHWYGFGIVNAEAAVTMAKSWQLKKPENILESVSSNLDFPLSDSLAPAVLVASIANPSGAEFTVTSVVVKLDLQHFSRGDLEVKLTSPQGTESILHPGKRFENTQLDPEDRWELMTVRSWGEDAVGTWRLQLKDLRIGPALEDMECADAPFNGLFDTEIVTCVSMVENELCANGATVDNLSGILDIEDNGRTVDEACCACGGGLTRSSYADTLREWSLIIYGEDLGATVTDMPTNVLSESPSMALSAQPSIPPTSIPPTRRPTTPVFRANVTTVKDGDDVAKDSTQIAITAGATVIVFCLVFACLYFTLRDPKKGKGDDLEDASV